MERGWSILRPPLSKFDQVVIVRGEIINTVRCGDLDMKKPIETDVKGCSSFFFSLSLGLSLTPLPARLTSLSGSIYLFKGNIRGNRKGEVGQFYR